MNKSIKRRLVMYSFVAVFVVVLVVLILTKLIEVKDFLTYLLTTLGLVLTAEFIFITQKMNLKQSLEREASEKFVAAIMKYRKSLFEYMRILYFPFQPTLEDEDDIYDFSKHMMQERVETANALKKVVDSYDELSKVVETHRLALDPLMLMYKYLALMHDDIERSASDMDKKVMKGLKVNASDEDVKKQSELYKSISKPVGVQGFYAYDLGRETLNHFQGNVFNFKLKSRKGTYGLNKETPPISVVATEKSVYDLAFKLSKRRGWSDEESAEEARQTVYVGSREVKKNYIKRLKRWISKYLSHNL